MLKGGECVVREGRECVMECLPIGELVVTGIVSCEAMGVRESVGVYGVVLYDPAS